MTPDDIIRMATLAGARPGFYNQADMAFLQDFAAPLHARIAELEAKLYAVGAGGVGQSIKPQIQADTAPAAWAIYSDDGTALLRQALDDLRIKYSDLIYEGVSSKKAEEFECDIHALRERLGGQQ